MGDDNDRTLVPFGTDDGNEAPGRLIRRQWHDGSWFFSVVDVVGLLAETDEPRFYWANMKRRIQEERFREALSRCQPLKVPASNGKLYETD